MSNDRSSPPLFPGPVRSGALPRLCFLSYRQIRGFAMPVVAEYTGRAEIEVLDGTFGDALAIARDRLERGLVDAFVSAGSNASILRAGLQAPVATIQLTGFDLLQALIKARHVSSRVGVVMYGKTIPELDEVKDLLNIEVVQHAYQTPDDARLRFEQLRREGFDVIVGSSLVVELAEQAGLHGLLAYSLGSVRKGFEDALELARIARLEAGRYEQLNSVLHNLQEAVLAVDRDHRVIAINPAMQQLLGPSQAKLLGQPLDTIEPELSLQPTLASGQVERAVVQRFAQRDWVVNRTP
ncbi:MAG: PrpR N-terminal domain-containing protein, partial [Comamonas sp.]